MRGWCPAALLAGLCLAAPVGNAATYNATPANYQGFVASLQPGDTLNLAAGTYPLLDLGGMAGTAPARITIQGPASGPPAIVTINPSDPDCCNVVQLTDTSFVTLRNLTVDSALQPFVDGVKANGITHHIEIIDCIFVGQGSHQQTVAISTKGMAWNWVVRGNVITQAGTGMYFGDSNGTAPFINGIIENNLIVDTIGYNAQIKHQATYTQPAGLGAGPHRTTIRNNVFIKTRSQPSWPPGAVDGGRPNLLVGGFPDSGFGTNDLYDIYGNFFYQNVDGEPLLQATGRVAAHDNILVGGSFRAMSFVNHENRAVRRAYAYDNTIYNSPTGIVVAGGPLEDSRVSGNLIFAATGVNAPVQMQNAVDTVANAVNYVAAPSMTLGGMNFHPLPGQALGTPLDISPYTTHVEYFLDFNGAPRGAFTRRGAYAGEGANPGWPLSATRKPYVAPLASADDDRDGIPNGVEGTEGLNTLVKDNDIFGVARLFGMQQYRDFLGREGDAGGIDFYTQQITGGAMTRAQVVEAFTNSPEFQSGLPQCTRLYLSFFGRIPDYPGLVFQVGQFRSGVPLDVIAQNFSNSPEFTSRYGALTNDQYINLVYQNVLGRAPDPGGYDFYFTRLESGALTRGQMMIGFSESPEFTQMVLDDVFTIAVYVGTLRRTPEQSGLDFYVDLLGSGRHAQPGDHGLHRLAGVSVAVPAVGSEPGTGAWVRRGVASQSLIIPPAFPTRPSSAGPIKDATCPRNGFASPASLSSRLSSS